MLEQTTAYRRRWIAFIFMGISMLIISLDNTVLNLALPSIAKDLGSTSAQLQWIVDAYVLAIAGCLLTIGYLGDRLGRKPALIAGLLIFGLFSLGAALSTSNGMLIAMRAIMGIGSATIMPATLSILTATFRQPKERAQAIALWAAVFSLGMGIGPVVGGYLLEHFHWSSVFYINIPVIIIGLIGSSLFIQNSKSETPRKIDILGAVLSAGGVFALVFAIIQAGQDGWTAPHVLWAFAATVVLLTVFIIWELKYKDAMLPLNFFKNMSFTGANVALVLVHFGMVGSFFFLGQFLQSVQGYSPLQAGIRLLPMAAVSFVAAAVSAIIARLIGTKYTIAIGIAISAAGFYYFSTVAAVDMPYSSFVFALCIVSLGIGFTMSPSTNSIMASVPVNQSGIASAMNSTTRQIGSALGVAVLGTILNSTYIADINAVAWPPSLPANALAAIQNSVQGANIVAQTAQQQSPQLAQLITNSAHQAFTAGAERALVIGAVIMAVSAILTLFIVPNKVKLAEPEEKRIEENVKASI
jgi:EmrB/QacA subfamily drug resistance transporter